MTDNIEELKSLKRDNFAIMRTHMYKAFEQLDKLAAQDKIIYLNGKSEEVKNEALACLKKIKTKDLNAIG